MVNFYDLMIRTRVNLTSRLRLLRDAGGQYAAVDADDDGVNLDALIYSELLVSRQ